LPTDLNQRKTDTDAASGAIVVEATAVGVTGEVNPPGIRVATSPGTDHQYQMSLLPKMKMKSQPSERKPLHHLSLRKRSNSSGSSTSLSSRAGMVDDAHCRRDCFVGSEWRTRAQTMVLADVAALHFGLDLAIRINAWIWIGTG
jgi:hypothetical protein